MDYILETKNLTKNIKNESIIKGLSLKVPKGETYGLLGPNGAGKSTTMKLLCGLLKPSKGEVIFKGKPWSRDSLNKIGVLIENPAIYGNLTAKENMLIHACMLGVSEREITHVLKLLKIDTTGKKKVSNFSLGMKQRLGIAIALLGNPDLVILDEPTNGLDPIGIQELRDLIKRLNDNQITVLVSSHNLAEIQHIASYIGIIINGKLKYEGEINETDDLENIFMNVTKEEECLYV